MKRLKWHAVEVEYQREHDLHFWISNEPTQIVYIKGERYIFPMLDAWTYYERVMSLMIDKEASNRRQTPLEAADRTARRKWLLANPGFNDHLTSFHEKKYFTWSIWEIFLSNIHFHRNTFGKEFHTFYL